MATPAFQPVLRALPFMAALPEAAFAQVAAAFQTLRFDAQQTVVAYGQPTQGLFVFTEGEGTLWAQAADGTWREVGRLLPGQSLGQSALTQRGTETVTLVTTRPSTVLFLSRRAYNELLGFHPQLRALLGSSPGEPGVARGPLNAAPLEMVRDNEHTLLETKRHRWVVVRNMGVPLLLLLGGGVVGVIVGGLGGLVLAGVLTVLAGLGALYVWAEWANDKLVITDQRIIHVERNILGFSTNVSEMPLLAIQEVQAEQPPGDLFARLFDYGTLRLRNASDASEVTFSTLANADQVQDLVLAQRDQQKAANAVQSRSAIRAALEQQLGLGNMAAVAPLDGVPASATPTGTPLESEHPSFWRALSPVRMRRVAPNGDTILRKHVTVWLMHVLPPFALILGGLVVGLLAALSVLGPLLWPVAVGLVLVGGVWGYLADWDYRNDMVVLADDMITIIHRRPLWLQNEVEQVVLSRVDNVTSETSGLLDTLLNRGKVRVSLFGEDLASAKVFHNQHRPHEIQAEISRRRARARAQDQQADTLRQQQAFSEYVAAYNDILRERVGAAPAPSGQPGAQASPPRPVVPPPPSTLPQDPYSPRPARVPPVRRDGGPPPI